MSTRKEAGGSVRVWRRFEGEEMVVDVYDVHSMPSSLPPFQKGRSGDGAPLATENPGLGDLQQSRKSDILWRVMLIILYIIYILYLYLYS